MPDKLDVIRKLLAKADRAATPAEAQTYTDKAVQMCARHGIDAAMLAARGETTDEISSTRITVRQPYSAEKARLLAWLATAMRCRAVLHSGGRGVVRAVSVFGHASDRARVEVLYTSLLIQATTQLARIRPDGPESVAAYRRSWLHGFAVEIHNRVKDLEERAATEAQAPSTTGPSAAVVLADRTGALDRAFAAAFPALGAARPRRLAGSGHYDGAVAAQRADLGQRRLSASS